MEQRLEPLPTERICEYFAANEVAVECAKVVQSPRAEDCGDLLQNRFAVGGDLMGYDIGVDDLHAKRREVIAGGGFAGTDPAGKADPEYQFNIS